MKKKLFFVCTAGVLAFTAQQAAAEDTVFDDVSEDHWALTAIQQMHDVQIIEGYPDGTFEPEEVMTREEAGVIMYRALGIQDGEYPDHRFDDLDEDSFGYHEVLTLTEVGLFEPVDDFRPEDDLTRAEMAKILVEAYQLPVSEERYFDDVDESHWASSYIDSLRDAGVTQGMTEDTFEPETPVSRAQMSTFVHRLMHEEPQGETDTAQEMAEDILHYTNMAREEHGLDPLEQNLGVEEAAMHKAEDMVVHDYFDHVSPEYGDHSDLLAYFDIEYLHSGENIARGQSSAEEVVDAWMDSEGHRENILNPDYTHLGAGYHAAEDGTPYYVQLFLRP
ncbi:S-layer homology domain-containing protein [Alkalicoccus chagannorensis]|uniref:CAP and S-layer homology domain-containing protein n=1 Tax=Alkalicoccus chagannorensis TaxID=427072 RepID=UPI00041BCCCA|nr:S-layer homology domain-containing protein [Alkalicoccus chagannorensis]